MAPALQKGAGSRQTRALSSNPGPSENSMRTKASSCASSKWRGLLRLAGAGIAKVKAAGGPDLIVWGSSTLTPLLIAEGLADEVVLLMFPVMIGRGKRIFSDLVQPSGLSLIESKVTPTGVVISTYKPAGALRVGSF